MRIEQNLSRSHQQRSFGRKGVAVAMPAQARPSLVDDIKLFTLTFAGGFLFVSLYLA